MLPANADLGKTAVESDALRDQDVGGGQPCRGKDLVRYIAAANMDTSTCYIYERGARVTRPNPNVARRAMISRVRTHQRVVCYFSIHPEKAGNATAAAVLRDQAPRHPESSCCVTPRRADEAEAKDERPDRGWLFLTVPLDYTLHNVLMLLFMSFS